MAWILDLILQWLNQTTVGQLLAEKLNCCFQDADVFHSEENKRKMSQGIPLTDQDRIPWLVEIHKFIKELYSCHENGVIACSALKRMYRNVLLTGEVTLKNSDSLISSVLFVYLHGDRRVLEERMVSREGHFMPVTLLDSQLDILEVPGENEHSLTINIDQSVDSIVAYIVSHSGVS